MDITEPNIKNLIKLADYYQVSIDYLVGRKWNDEIGYLSQDIRDIVEKLKKLDKISILRAEAYISALEEKN